MNILDIFAIIGVIATVVATGFTGFQTWLAFEAQKDQDAIPTISDKKILRVLRALINEEEGRLKDFMSDK